MNGLPMSVSTVPARAVRVTSAHVPHGTWRDAPAATPVGQGGQRPARARRRGRPQPGWKQPGFAFLRSSPPLSAPRSASLVAEHECSPVRPPPRSRSHSGSSLWRIGNGNGTPHRSPLLSQVASGTPSSRKCSSPTAIGMSLSRLSRPALITGRKSVPNKARSRSPKRSPGRLGWTSRVELGT